MIKAIVTDFSRVLLFPADDGYAGGLNVLQRELTARGSYNFWDHFRLNDALLAFYAHLHKRVDVYIFSSEYIQEHPALQSKLDDVFKDVLSGARLGLKKTDVDTYAVVARLIGLRPEEVLYVDDNTTYCDTAARAGMVIVHYISNDQTTKAINEALGADLA